MSGIKIPWTCVGIETGRRRAKGASGNNGLDNTYSLTRWKKYRHAGETYRHWYWRTVEENGGAK